MTEPAATDRGTIPDPAADSPGDLAGGLARVHRVRHRDPVPLAGGLLIAVAGSLVGNYMELVELMELNAEGRVKLHAQQYKLDDINTAIDDFKKRKIVGRGVIVP